MKFITNSSEETQELGIKLAKSLRAGDVIALEGEVGAGKTELVRGIMLYLNPDEIVRSPSFSLVNSYNCSKFSVNHFDFYRLSSADDLWEVGYEEYINEKSVCLIEWAQMFKDSLPKHTKIITFKEINESCREIELSFEIAL